MLPDASSKPVWETSSRPTGQLVRHRADLQNMKTSHIHFSLREKLTKQLLLKYRKKKTGEYSQPPGETN
jgi:hypothetical protein